MSVPPTASSRTDSGHAHIHAPAPKSCTHDHGGHHSGHGHEHPHDHGHEHGHGAGHQHVHGSDEKTLMLAVSITLGFAIIEALGGWLTGSLALLGDSGHMFSDSLALALAAFAARIARRPADHRHSYGLGRAEALAALANAVMMFGIVAAIAWEAVARIANPVAVQAGPAAAVAAIGLVVNLAVAWLLSRNAKSLNVRAALLHVMGDLLGSIAALGALATVYFTGWMAADPILSLLICGLILASSVSVLRETVHVLLDGVPRGLSLAEIGNRIASVEGIVSVHDLHVWNYAPGRIALSAHLLISDASLWAAILVAARQRIAVDFGIEHVTLQPELAGEERVPVSRLSRRAITHTH